jgi:hypothetical protein
MNAMYITLWFVQYAFVHPNCQLFFILQFLFLFLFLFYFWVIFEKAQKIKSQHLLLKLSKFCNHGI